MPVAIYRVTPKGQKNERVAWLCDQQWELCPQAEALERWLEQTGQSLPPAEYIADVGFKWRRDASAGGAALPPAMLRRMADIGMSLFLSEYGGFTDESE